VTTQISCLGRIRRRACSWRVRLDMARTIQFMKRCAWRDAVGRTVCAGNLDVANSVMEKAIRVIFHRTRTRSSRLHTGGIWCSGALHACDLAAPWKSRACSCRVFRALFPRLAFCALNVTKDFSHTIRLEVATPLHFAANFARNSQHSSARAASKCTAEVSAQLRQD